MDLVMMASESETDHERRGKVLAERLDLPVPAAS
jgi:hypothetical protein